jgi:hypothetical protein
MHPGGSASPEFTLPPVEDKIRKDQKLLAWAESSSVVIALKIMMIRLLSIANTAIKTIPIIARINEYSTRVCPRFCALGRFERRASSVWKRMELLKSLSRNENLVARTGCRQLAGNR